MCVLIIGVLSTRLRREIIGADIKRAKGFQSAGCQLIDNSRQADSMGPTHILKALDGLKRTKRVRTILKPTAAGLWKAEGQNEKKYLDKLIS